MVKFILYKIKNLNRHKIYNILFILLLLISFLLRIINSEPSHYTEDFNVSYLVGYHIIKYHELPLIGPWSGTLSWLKSSPSYFYLIALLLKINDHPLFLNFANILFQIGTIMAIFLIAKKAFGKATALSASTLFSFSKVSLDQSIFSIWGPHAMQPFINFSYLLLLLTFTQRNFNLLLFGVVLFIFAGALHNSAFSLLPFYLLICFFILGRLNAKYRYYVSLCLTTVLSFLFFFLPQLVYWYKNNLNVLEIVSAKMGVMRYDFLQRFIYDISVFIDNFFSITTKSFSNILILIIVILTILFYFLLKRDKIIKKCFSVVLVIAIIWQSIIVGLVDLKDPSFLGPSVWGIIRYFTPIFGLFIILIAHTIHSVFSGNMVLRIARVLLIILLLNTFSHGLGGLLQTTKNNLLHPRNYENPAVEAVKNEVLLLKQENHAPNLNFFQLVTYGHENINSYFWVVLERELHTKFVKINDNLWNSYESINNDKYIFLICNNLGSETCQNEFVTKNQNYKILGQIYSQGPFLIYLTKRTI